MRAGHLFDPCPTSDLSGGALRGHTSRSATIWVSGRTRDPYFDSSSIIVARSVGFDRGRGRGEAANSDFVRLSVFAPKVISLISKVGAMMVFIKAGFMSLCHSLEQRMALCQPANNLTMTCTGGTGHALSSCLLELG